RRVITNGRGDMRARQRVLRVGVYGTGTWACRTHIPNLQRLQGVAVAALSDADPERLQAAAAQFGVQRTYADAHEMLDREELDILFSVVPAFARTDVEAEAAGRGVHLFSEKPQALTMAVARRIDEAVRRAGVLSTVCFRERYRPLFQQARRLLAGRKVVHVRFQMAGGLPLRQSDVPAGQEDQWHYRMDQAGGPAFDWGVHAVDYVRFMTGLDVEQAQAFYHHPAEFNRPLSCSFSFQLGGGATMTMTFVSAAPLPSPAEPPFTVFCEGGHLALWMYDRIAVDGQVVYRADEFDPWFEQDRVFVEAVRSGDPSGILNDYHDGLFSLAPVLAGWESARGGGTLIHVPTYMAA
ncbi:MAG: Gfo/Idh/MocA family oxidoreductase, partial [Candidatus Latescibacterota bacterium]